MFAAIPLLVFLLSDIIIGNDWIITKPAPFAEVEDAKAALYRHGLRSEAQLRALQP